MKERISCGMLIKQINDSMRKQVNNHLRSCDLTMAQVGVLLELRKNTDQQMTLKELERSFRVAQSTAAGLVSRLEQKNFVESFGDSKDKRIKIVRITKKGEQFFQEADEHRKQTEEQLLSELTETEQESLLSLLKKVRDSLH
ncbi:MAG: MarR family transcriptional regulator [Oscillospiraceae bacterium]|nr:MarR family transcriptional regulator [Oscillospiraceae bacterium]